MIDTIGILDRLSPDEADLPPSARKWARVIRPNGLPVLELRFRNSVLDADPASKPRYQYLVMGGVLWRRRLPPAPLEDVHDETPWVDTPLRWELYDAGGLVGEWAEREGAARTVRIQPAAYQVHRDIHGDGGDTYDAYAMPPRDPWDMWAAITGAPCPVEGCDQTLVWYEAGYVPGYRVCMRQEGEHYNGSTLRHRFVLDHAGMVLIREA